MTGEPGRRVDLVSGVSEGAIGPVWETGLSVSTSGPDILEPYRVREMHELFVEQLPRNALGKVQHFLLRDAHRG